MLLALLPLIIFYPLTIITAPLAIFIAIYGWKKPRSIVRTGNFRFIAAILLSLLEIGLWIALILSFWKPWG